METQENLNPKKTFNLGRVLYYVVEGIGLVILLLSLYSKLRTLFPNVFSFGKKDAEGEKAPENKDKK